MLQAFPDIIDRTLHIATQGQRAASAVYHKDLLGSYFVPLFEDRGDRFLRHDHSAWPVQQG